MTELPVTELPVTELPVTGLPATELRARLRVVHVITTLTTGGAERQVELLAAASRHDIRVICLYRGGVVEQALQARGIPVQTLGMDGWRKAVAIVRLARLLRAQAPDVVHVHLLSAQLWGIPAARLARVPVIVSTEHSIMETTIEGRPKSRQLRLLYRLLEKMTTHTIAVSEATVRRLRDWGIRDPSRITIINPPIDFAALRIDGRERAGVRAELQIPADAMVVGAVGRLDPVKRFPQLLQALTGRLRAGAHLVVVGDGELRGELEEQAAAAGVASAVHLTGPRADVARLLDGCDVFVSPSRDESFGMAVVEALGAGLPVVYAQCPALDGLELPLTQARKIDTRTEPAAERAELDRAVGELVAAGARDGDVDGDVHGDVHGDGDGDGDADGRRFPAPAALVERYGVASTAAAVDRLYDKLTRPTPPLR